MSGIAPRPTASEEDGSSETDSKDSSSSSSSLTSSSSSSSSSVQSAPKVPKPKAPVSVSATSLRTSPQLKKSGAESFSRSSSRIPRREVEIGMRASNELRVSGDVAKDTSRADRTEEIIKEKSREEPTPIAPALPIPGKSPSLSYIEIGEKLALPPCAPVTLAFSNLAYSVKAKGQQPDIEAGAHAEPNRKYLLKGLHGIVRPGQLLCVLGPSGSGKTTLLDLLARRVSSGRQGGSVTLNGRDLDDKVFRSICKYVPQEDSLIGSFTVKETLMYAARFWLSISEAEMETRVDKLITELGLSDASDTIIGTVFQKGISGGQKRRVSLGVELIANPSLLFLDEPTSGLDAAAAFHVMQILRRLCQAGRSVVCTIHQPSSEVFHMSDNVLLLSKGHQVYFGPSSTVTDYFSALGYPCPPATNPADYILNILNTDFPTHGDLNKIVTTYKASKGLQQIEADLKKLDGLPELPEQPKPNVLSETVTLMRRGFEYIVRNPGIYWVRLAMYVMLAIMLGTLYLRMPYKADTIQDRISLLFFICAFMVFMSVAVLPQFLLDRPVFVRERAGGSYGPATYVLSQTVVSVPGVALIATITSAIVYWLAHLNPSGPRFGFFLVDLFLALFVAEGLIHLVSACVPFFIIGLVAAAGLYGGFMLTEGFFLIKSNIPPWWIWMYYIGFHTYSFESFMYNEFSGREFSWNSNMRSAWAPSLTSNNGTTGVVLGEEVLRLYEMNHDHRARDMGILIAMAAIYRIGYYLALKILHSGKR